MNIIKNNYQIIKFSLYIVIIILLNIVLNTFSIRFDLTKDKNYSLSELTKSTVSSLEEPLIVKAFFTDNLPQAYSSIPQEFSDLMDEFSLSGNKFFNYQVYTIDGSDLESDENMEIIQMASEYNIAGVRLPDVEGNQTTLTDAFIGLVFLSGDMIETIPVLNSDVNLEYVITNTISKMSNKSSSLLSMENDAVVELVLSSDFLEPNLYQEYVDSFADLIAELNYKTYNRISFKLVDPSDSTIFNYYKKLGVDVLTQEDGNLKLFGAIVNYDSKNLPISLIRQNYGSIDFAEINVVMSSIENSLYSLLGVNQRIGLLADHDSPSFFDSSYGVQGQRNLSNFFNLIRQEWEVEFIFLEENQSIPPGIKTLIITDPNKQFSEWELYILDQFVVNGGSIALFYDQMVVYEPNQQEQAFGAQIEFLAKNTGIEKLLEHWEISIMPQYIYDKHCYESISTDPRTGQNNIEKVYFYPQLQRNSINKENEITSGINELILVRPSPIDLSVNLLASDRLTILLESSSKSWLLPKLELERLVPPSENDLDKYPISVIVDGPFTSYFNGDDLPQKIINEDGINDISLQGDVVNNFKSEGDGGSVFLISTSNVISNEILSLEANRIFALNVIDYLNGNKERAEMRSKTFTVAPIDKTTEEKNKNFIKNFNTFIVPAIVIVIALFFWLYYRKRRSKIEANFKISESED